MIDQIVNDVGLRGLLLDRQGIVISLSEDRTTAATRDNPLLSAKPGDSYLGTCASPDPQFIEVHRGIKSLLERKIDFFSTLYWYRSAGELVWYLVAAFPRPSQLTQTVVLLIDVSHAMKASVDLSAMMIGRGPAAASQVESIITNTIRRAISDTLSLTRQAPAATPETHPHPDRARLSKLSKVQLELVGLLAKGLTNTEIADQRNVSVNTIKTQVADVMQKLGLSNRTQIALFAAKHQVPRQSTGT